MKVCLLPAKGSGSGPLSNVCCSQSKILKPTIPLQPHEAITPVLRKCYTTCRGTNWMSSKFFALVQYSESAVVVSCTALSQPSVPSSRDTQMSKNLFSGSLRVREVGFSRMRQRCGRWFVTAHKVQKRKCTEKHWIGILGKASNTR